MYSYCLLYTSYRNNPHPACFLISLENTKQEEIQETTGEGKSYCNIQHMRDHVCTSCQHYLCLLYTSNFSQALTLLSQLSKLSWVLQAAGW